MKGITRIVYIYCDINKVDSVDELYPFGRKDTAQMLMNADIIMGNSTNRSYVMDDIMKDRERFPLLMVFRDFYYNNDVGEELPELLRYLAEASRSSKKSKKSQKAFIPTFGTFKTYLDMKAWYCPFEPAWHMKMRGDTKKLPNTKFANYWGYLRDLYVEPKMSAEDVPEWVKKGFGKYSCYESLVTEARQEGMKELRKRYGDNWKVEANQKHEYSTISDNEMFLDGSLLDMIRNA